MQPMRMPSVTFAGLPAWPDPGRPDGPIAVLGAEHATPYHVGEPSHSAGGPAALRAALTGYARLGEQYDFDLGGVRPDEAVDCGDVPGDPADAHGNREAITAAVRALLDRDVVPVVQGAADRRADRRPPRLARRGPRREVRLQQHHAAGLGDAVDPAHRAGRPARGRQRPCRGRYRRPCVGLADRPGARGSSPWDRARCERFGIPYPDEYLRPRKPG